MTNEENHDMNIVDQFAGRRRKKLEPGLDMPMPAHPTPATLHPAAQEAAVIYSRALEEVDSLKRELAEVTTRTNATIEDLRNALELERRYSTDVNKMLDTERRLKERYMRYSVEVKTHLGHVAMAAVKANDVAMQIANEEVVAAAEEVKEASEYLLSDQK